MVVALFGEAGRNWIDCAVRLPSELALPVIIAFLPVAKSVMEPSTGIAFST